MSWRNTLQPASFRGVPFYVESANYSGGRRSILHEYPQRDKPSSEDHGRSRRKFPINAFIVGENFIVDHKKLIEALEEKGSGTLIHPFYGEQTVVLSDDFTVTISSSNGGMVAVSIPFIEAGETAYPVSATDTISQTRLSSDALSDAAKSLFASQFTLDGMPDFVRESAIVKIGDVTGLITGTLKTVVPGVDQLSGNLMSQVHSLVDNPIGLAQAISSLIGSVKNVLDIPGQASSMMQDMLRAVGVGQVQSKSVKQSDTCNVNPADVVQKLVSVAEESGSAVHPMQPLFNTPARVQEAQNVNAIEGLVRNEALANASGAATVLPPLVYDDVKAVRDKITIALDTEALYAPAKTYEALSQLRVDVYKDLTKRASDSARLREITLPQVMPALVIAYDLYETAERADEIVGRNQIINPAFVPAEPIKVLTK